MTLTMTQPRLVLLLKAGPLKRVVMMMTIAVTMKKTIMNRNLIRHVAWILGTQNVSIRAFLFAAHLGI
jgi:hypothetical protein